MPGVSQDAEFPQDGGLADGSSEGDAATDAAQAPADATVVSADAATSSDTIDGPDAGPCTSDAACDDGKSCTLDKCVVGKCVHELKKGACDDPNGCPLAATCVKDVCTPSQAAVVESLAGTGKVDTKIGKPATQGALNRPVGVAIGADDAAYVIAQTSQDIRRIDSEGLGMAVFAGFTGKTGFAEGKPGTGKLNKPSGITHVAKNVFYVADTNNMRIRTVQADGTLGTLVGSHGPTVPVITTGASSRGKNAIVGLVHTVAADDAAGTYFLAEKNHAVWHVSAFGTVSRVAAQNSGGFKDGPLDKAAMEYPIALARLCNGNLLVGDSTGRRIRLVDFKLKVVKTLAGNGQVGHVAGSLGVGTIAQPRAIGIDSGGRVSFVDFLKNGKTLIRSVDPVSGVLTNVAGVGLPTLDPALQKVTFGDLSAMAVDRYGRMWVTDRAGHRLHRVTLLKGACAVGKGTCAAAGVQAPSDKCSVCDATKNPSAWTATKPCSGCKLP